MNKRDIEFILQEAKVNGYASKYFQTYHEAHNFNNKLIYHMKIDKNFDWNKYSVSVSSQYDSYYRLTIRKGKESKKENKYEWVIRNLTLTEMLNITVLPKELNNDKDLQWLLESCEELLEEKIRISIRSIFIKTKECLIAKLERLGNSDEIQSEIIFQSKNGK